MSSGSLKMEGDIVEQRKCVGEGEKMGAELTPESIREFVISSHFNLEKVKTLAAENPALLRAQNRWGEGDFEDGLGAAAHVGNRGIAMFFLSQGVPLTICAAAMLGDEAAVAAFVAADPAAVNARGAHGIPLMFHAAMSGEVGLAQFLRDKGCNEGYTFALHGAIMHGRLEMVRWLLDNGAADLQIPNYEGKSPLTKAVELGHTEIAELLRSRGAME